MCPEHQTSAVLSPRGRSTLNADQQQERQCHPQGRGEGCAQSWAPLQPEPPERAQAPGDAGGSRGRTRGAAGKCLGSSDCRQVIVGVPRGVRASALKDAEIFSWLEHRNLFQIPCGAIICQFGVGFLSYSNEKGHNLFKGRI